MYPSTAPGIHIKQITGEVRRQNVTNFALHTESNIFYFNFRLNKSLQILHLINFILYERIYKVRLNAFVERESKNCIIINYFIKTQY